MRSPRTAARALALALATLAVAACGGAEGDRAAAGTRSFVDVRGEPITVPADPQRIVAIHDGNGGVQVLELGHELVGFPTRGGEFSVDGPEGAFDLGDAEPVGQVYEPNVELIAALEPDLIVGEGYAGKGMDQFMDEGVERRLQRIAPTVDIDVFRPVEEVMADFAELLGPGATDRYRRLRGDYEAALAGYRDRIAGKEGLSGVFVQHEAEASIDLWGATALPATNTLTRLGVRQPPITAAADEPGNGGYLSGISLERTPEMSADVILLESGQDGEHSGDHRGNPLWRALPAVAAGQVVATDDSWYGTTFATYRHVLEQVGPALADADPDLVREPWEERETR